MIVRLQKARSGVACLFLLMIVVVALCWPSFINGEPFLFPDTLNYLRSVNRMAQQVTGYTSEWLAYPISDPSVPAGERIIMLGRSPYYGALLFVSQFLTSSFWPAIVVQATLAAVCILLTLKRFGSQTAHRLNAVSIGARALIVAIVTPFAFFASYLMPDIFAGLAVLATVHLSIFWPQLGRWERLFWAAILLAGLLVHSANLLIIGGLLALCLLVRLIGLPLSLRGLALVLTVLAAATLNEIAFPKAVEAATGTKPIRPPFLTARITADGPGTEYLVKSCPESGFLLCKYQALLPLDSDVFLWGQAPQPGVFSKISPRERSMLAAEQNRFVIAVFRDRPLDLIGSSLGQPGANWAC
jgi:hypothetical protein